MKSKINQFLLIAAILITASLYLQSCKNDTIVEPPPPEEPKVNVPVLLSPHNESSSQVLTPTLDWEDFKWDGSINAESYGIQISLDANFEGIMVLDSSGITASELQIQPGRLTTNSYYYWRVRATGSFGTTNWSQIWRFNIILTAPDPPVLISPPNGAVNQGFTPLLDWSEVNNAQFYRLQLSAHQNFSSILIDTNRMINTEYTVPIFILTSNTTYYWRVNASNSNGVSTSQWSSPWNFATVSGPPPNSISGKIIFVDTNFAQPAGVYLLGIYTTWPPVGPPQISDDLNIVQGTNGYEADYFIRNVLNGTYYVTVVTTGSIPFGTPPVLGIYGCDTVHLQYSTCPSSPNNVTITNNFGHDNINFLSWADTLQRIY